MINAGPEVSRLSSESMKLLSVLLCLTVTVVSPDRQWPMSQDSTSSLSRVQSCSIWWVTELQVGYALLWSWTTVQSLTYYLVNYICKMFFFSLFIFLISSQFVVFSWRPCPKYYKCIHHLWQISHHCCHSPHQSQIGLMLESAGRINWCPSVFVCAVCRREWAGRQTGLSKRTQLSSMCHLLWWDWCSVSSPLRPWGERN